LDTLEMLYIGGNSIHREIIEAFVKTHMFGYFDPSRVDVIPQYILGGVGEKAKKDTFA
jgi:hypothetical protein